MLSTTSCKKVLVMLIFYVYIVNIPLTKGEGTMQTQYKYNVSWIRRDGYSEFEMFTSREDAEDLMRELLNEGLSPRLRTIRVKDSLLFA